VPLGSSSLDLLYPKILETLSNKSYMGELRQRWLEIKKLNNNTLSV